MGGPNYLSVYTVIKQTPIAGPTHVLMSVPGPCTLRRPQPSPLRCEFKYNVEIVDSGKWGPADSYNQLSFKQCSLLDRIAYYYEYLQFKTYQSRDIPRRRFYSVRSSRGSENVRKRHRRERCYRAWRRGEDSSDRRCRRAPNTRTHRIPSSTKYRSLKMYSFHLGWIVGKELRKYPPVSKAVNVSPHATRAIFAQSGGRIKRATSWLPDDCRS